MNKLGARVTEAIEESGVDVAAVAATCHISVQAVYKWMDGRSKSIKGEYLVELARITGYEARWIISGKGNKRIDPKAMAVLRVMENLPEYKKDVLVATSNSLTEHQKHENNGTQ